MPPGLADRLKKITIRTLPVYILGLIILATARPRPELIGLGLPLVILGEGLRVWATGYLHKNEEVTTSGPYAFVKNPLYLGTFLIMIGFCVMADHLLLLALGGAVFVIYYAPYKKRRESERMAQKFGEAWRAYDHGVPDYFPRLTPYPNGSPTRWKYRSFLNNSEHHTLIGVLLGIMTIGVRFFL